MTLEGVSETEEATIGGVVFYNNNDSDDNDLMDLLDDFGRTVTDIDWAQLHIDPISPVGIGGTYALTFSGAVRIWLDNENGTFSYVQSGFTMSAADPPVFYVEGFSADGVDTITLDFVAPNGTSVPKVDTIKVKSEVVAVEWAKIADSQTSPAFNHAEGRLEHTKAIAKNKGAYIPLNDDDDEFNLSCLSRNWNSRREWLA
jgi:hypothetical protein